jgi:tRNA-specific 2-thiouridylase
MSGGVDSSVTAALLVEQGHEVIGVHMKLHDAAPAASGHCCGYDDALDARRVATELGIPFYVLDLREAFQRAVIDDLADTYLAGMTPNPCIQCNGVLKFRVLLARALALGASHLATGHYARVGPGPSLLRATDPDKDQSYFLFPMRTAALERTLFPLGDLTKPEVRAHARRFGLDVADKPESQEICFVEDDDHARFIRTHRPGVDGRGELVDEQGRVLGHHDGYFRFTVGQRRGLGVALGHRAYVLSIDPESHRVVVGGAAALARHELTLERPHWLQRPDPDREVSVRIRHRGALLRARVGGGDRPTVSLLDPARGVAPGQAAVIYEGERVLGGGWIARSARTHDARGAA